MKEELRVTAAVMEFVSEARIHHFPAEVIALAKRCIIDGMGLILAGSTTAGSTILRERVKRAGAASEATVLGREPFKSTASEAALLNGSSGHAMDFDDTQLSRSPEHIYGLLTHPTVPPLVAAMAIAERRRLSGAAMLEAFVVGFEVECKIAEAIDPNHYKRGFHSSGTIGTFGAAMAAAKLLGLDAAAVGRTLGIASSLCGGIRVNFGTMTKPLHVGRAAESGVIAAELASAGFTAGADALDGPWGFFSVFGGSGEPGRIVGQLGRPYSIVDPGVSIKPYPCGVLGHPSMDAMLTLVTTHDLRPEQIARIRLRAGSNILNPLRYHIATGELEAKFSPAFMLSSIALRRKAGIHEFTDEFVRSEAVQEMMGRVERVFDQDIEAMGFQKIRSVVEVYLHDGRRFEQVADEKYRGGPDRPFTREELYEKFSECAALVLPEERLQRLLERLESLERVDDVEDLVRGMAVEAETLAER